MKVLSFKYATVLRSITPHLETSLRCKLSGVETRLTSWYIGIPHVIVRTSKHDVASQQTDLG